MIFYTLQYRFILNTSVDSMFINFIIQSGAIWQKLIAKILLSRMLRGVQHNMFSRTIVWTIAEQNRLQQCIEKRKDRGYPRSA